MYNDTRLFIHEKTQLNSIQLGEANMFKKIVSIVATAAILVVGFSAMPASATATSNAGAVKKTNWNLSWSTPAGEKSADTSLSLSIQPGASGFSSYVNMNLGADFAKAHAGHQIRIEWNQVFPQGVTWHNGQYGSTGISKYIGGSGTGGYWPAYNDLQITQTSTDVNDPAGASLITIPANVSTMTSSQNFTISAGLSFDQWGGNAIVPGTYSFAPTLYDKTDGAAFTLSATSGTGNVWVDSKNYSQNGQGAFQGDIPAHGSLGQNLVACVSKSSLVEGHQLTIDRLANGVSEVSPAWNWVPFYAKGTQTSVGNSNPSYTVPAEQVGANGTGLRASIGITISNVDGTSAMVSPTTDLIIRDTTAGTQIEASCAAEAPAAPTLTSTSRYNATLSWTKNDSDVMVNNNAWDRSVSYAYKIYKASDLNTVIQSGEFFNISPTNDVYSQYIYFEDAEGNSAPLEVGTEYVARMTATNDADQVASPESPTSVPLILAAPAVPAAPTFTLPSLTSATLSWTKVTGDVANNGNGRTVNYFYAIYKESDPTVAVVSGSLWNATLNGETYTQTVNFPMGGAPNWMPISLDANTQYIAKIKSSNNNGDSAYSAPSTHYQIAGPATPNKPVITTVTVNNIVATVAVRTEEAAYTYRATAYLQSDSTFANPLGTGNCSAATPGATTYTCNISSMATGFNAPNLYVVRVISSNNTGMMTLNSLPSPASTAVIGGVPGVSITAPSNGTTAGDAKTITSTFPGITDAFGSTTGVYVPSKGIFINDGIGNVYTFADAGVDGSIGRKFELKKIKSDFTGYDESFGSAGKVSTTVAYGTGNTDVNLPSVWPFAKGTKFAMSTSVSNCAINGPCMSDGTYTFSEATAGQAFATPVNMAGKAQSFCLNNASPSFGTPTSAYFNSMNGFQGLSRPVAMVTCSKRDDITFNTTYERFAATIETDGTFTKLFLIHTTNATQNNYYRYSTSFNPTASAASDVAAVVYLVRYKNANGVSNNYERVIVRVKVDGSVTETPAGLVVSGSEPSVTLAPVNDGTTVYAINNTMGQNKFTSTPVASGGLEAGTVIAVDNAPMMGSVSLTFPQTGAPVVNGKVAFVRKDNLMSGTILAPMSYNVANGAVVTGEALTYNVSGSPVNYAVIDAAGHMNFIYTPTVAQQTLVHSVIQWKNVRGMVAVPTPAVSMPGSYFSLNAGGTSITIEGVNLAETSAAKKVTGIRFGMGTGTSGLVTTMTKTANSITVKVPTSVVAGATTVPTAAAPYSVPVTVVLGGGGTLMAGSVTYIGTTKLAQNVTLNVVTTPATTATPDRLVSAIVGAITPIEASVPIPAVVSSTTPTVCSIIDNKVHFISNGNCIVKAVKAGTDWLAEGSATSVAIPVLKADSVTAGFALGETPSEGLSEDDAVAPVITLASGRTDYTMTSADQAKCSINPDTKMIWFKAGNQNCVITIATAAANAQWAAVSYTWTIAMQPPAGGAGSPLLVRNDNVMVKLPGLGVKWDQKKNQVFFITRVKWIGPVQAKMTFIDDKGNADATDDVTYTCVSNFGILKKTPLPKANEPFIISSGAMCTEAKNEANLKQTPAEKLAQTAAYNAFKAIVARNTANGASTDVQFTYRRETHRSSTYEQVGDSLTTKPWSTPTFAKLYFRAIDNITVELPDGVVPAVSASADGAFNADVNLESKRTDYTMVSTDNTKCEVLTDGRIWAKVAGQNCVVTIGTGTNAIWAGKSYNWTVPMVAAIAADPISAIVAPSNNTPVNAGLLSVTWNQATSAVAVKLNSRSAGLARVKMQFTDMQNVVHTCLQSFGAKKLAGAIDDIKSQASKSFCAGADLVAFKALVAAKKAGSQVIPVSFSFQFEQYNPLTGVLLPGQVVNSDTKPWSANFFVKLNFRATAN